MMAARALLEDFIISILVIAKYMQIAQLCIATLYSSLDPSKIHIYIVFVHAILHD